MGANDHKDNEKRAFEKPRIMSKREREVCARLQILGVEAKPAVGGGREKIGAAGSFLEGFFEITEGPIRWLNYSGRAGTDSVWWSTQYGVPDARLNCNFPAVSMSTVRVKKFPVLGKVVDMYWKGEDFGLGILSRLNGDISIKHTIMRTQNIEIYAYGSHGCWIINVDKDKVPTAELWNCYQAIAQHLLAKIGAAAFMDVPVGKLQKAVVKAKKDEMDEENEYKNGEKVLNKARAWLRLPHKEPKQAECFVTESHVVIETEELTKIPFSRMKDCNIRYASRGYATVDQASLSVTLTLTFFDELNGKQKLLLDMDERPSNYFKWVIAQQIAKRKEQHVLSDYLSMAILVPLVGSFFVWLILRGIEGAAGAPAAGGSRVPYWLAGLFAACGAGMGVAISWGWAQKVSSWKRRVTFLVILPMMATVWVLVFFGVLGALPAAAIHAVLLMLSWLRKQERLRWPW